MANGVGTEAMPILLDHTDIQCEDDGGLETIITLAGKDSTCQGNRIIVNNICTNSQSDSNFEETRNSVLFKKNGNAPNGILDYSVHHSRRIRPKTIEHSVGISFKNNLLADTSKKVSDKPIDILTKDVSYYGVAVIPSEFVDVSMSDEQSTSEAYFLKIDSHHNSCEPLKIKCLDKIIQKSRDCEKELKCYKCNFCPLMTLSRQTMDVHKENKGGCSNLRPTKCPGCENIFYSKHSLRAHLQLDHNMVLKDVRLLLQKLDNLRIVQDLKQTSSCAFETNGRIVINSENFSTSQLQLVLPTSESNHLEHDRPSCAKRTTMLESYLDGISSKTGGEIPPRLTQNGTDLLENTFNFTAPVSEQLPSIQPENPPEAGEMDAALMQEANDLNLSDNNFLGHPTERNIGQHFLLNHAQLQNESQCLDHSFDKPNLLEAATVSVNRDQQAEENLEERQLIVTPQSQEFLGLPSVFVDQPDEQNRYKDGQQNEFLYISSDTAGIQLDDKTEPELDLSSYAAEPAVTESQLGDEKKSSTKKIGCGFRCDINGCKFRMQSEQNIKYHRRCHEGKIYNCPECCKDCPTWITLSSHLWQAHKIDMELYKCDLCSYRTPSYSRLTSIHRGIHGTSRNFLCDICGKGFKTVKQMRNHKNIHKAKMVRMSCCFCEICGRTVADKRLLEQHINTLHKKKKPFLCSICGYATALKHSLLVHMRKHTGEKPYECDKCEYKSADHNALRRHMMKHTGARNYKCTHCSYSCIQASTYKAHIRLKHPDLESEIIFSCNQCNFQTLQRGKYLSHAAEHGNGKIPDTAPFYSETVELGPIMSERVVETIVDLSGAQSFLAHEYYEVERIARS